MAGFQIAAILRSPAYSPNHIGNDAALLNSVCAQLRKRGCAVNIYTEAELMEGKVTEKVIASMCRERKSLEMLQQLEDGGALVINSAYGVENCKRERLGRILQSNQIPYPDSVLTLTDRSVKPQLEQLNFSRCWVKRADFHSQHKEDITFALNPQEAQDIVKEYFLRGIRTAVIDRHLEGNLVKFYGIRGTTFFHWYHPFDRQQNASGLDPTDGSAPTFTFSVEALQAMCQRAATALGIDIYGGDAIVDASGSITIININDWPSFARCRDEATPIIARLILAAAKQKFTTKKRNLTSSL
jgi:hypothetical protein